MKAADIIGATVVGIVFIYLVVSFVLWDFDWPVDAIIATKTFFVWLGVWPIWARVLLFFYGFVALAVWFLNREFR